MTGGTGQRAAPLGEAAGLGLDWTPGPKSDGVGPMNLAGPTGGQWMQKTLQRHLYEVWCRGQMGMVRTWTLPLKHGLVGPAASRDVVGPVAGHRRRSAEGHPPVESCSAPCAAWAAIPPRGCAAE